MIRTFKDAFISGLAEALENHLGQKRNLKSWSFWFIETKETIKYAAIKGAVDRLIPQDGSFMSAYCIQKDLTKAEAEDLVDEVKENHERKS